MTLDQIKQETLCVEYINRIKTKNWKKFSVLQTFSLDATMFYFTENASWFSRHCRNLFWKIFTLTIQDAIGWKLWYVPLSIGQTWANIVKKSVTLRKGCDLAAKAHPIKFSPWPNLDLPWSRIHIDFAGPLERLYYFIVVDSFSVWPEIHM